MAHKEMRGLEYLIYSTLSLCLLIVMVFLPLAPAFADETEATTESVNELSVATQVSEIQESTEQGDADTLVEDDQVVSQRTNEEVVVADISPNDGGLDEAVPLNEGVTNDTLDDEEGESLFGEDDVISETTTSSDLGISISDFDDAADYATSSKDVAIKYEPSVDAEIGQEEGDTPSTDELNNEVQADAEPYEEDDQESNEGIEIVESEDEANSDDQPEDKVVIEENLELAEGVGEEITVNAVRDDSNKFSFSKDECTAVGDGTFYCAEAKEDAQVTFTDRIFSAKDVEGDKEIYVEKEGVLTQLSNNQFDDDAPYYDEVSNTAVWHRLIAGRYQIVVYDLDTEEEVQLTHDRYNNMQPNRFGDAIVWQGWVGSDWEIFLETKQGIKMLTDNTTHDITPSVNGTHIVWQSFENNVWQMKVYDMRTGAIDTIENAEGGSIENPRFVLVYDTKFESGDIETKGYDLKSGEVVHLSAKPVSLPEELPDPDQTGEERALVSTVTQLKPKTESDDDTTPDTTGGSNGDPENGDIIIDTFAPNVQSTSTVAIESDSVDVNIPTIEIPALEEVATSSVDHITDVIVTPYLEEVATSTDAH